MLDKKAFTYLNIKLVTLRGFILLRALGECNGQNALCKDRVAE
jgi:hypothetical protein